MPDYRCPNCRGGFPAAAASDGCPWCGESMDGGDSTSVPLSTPPRQRVPDSLKREDPLGDLSPENTSDERPTNPAEEIGADLSDMLASWPPEQPLYDHGLGASTTAGDRL